MQIFYKSRDIVALVLFRGCENMFSHTSDLHRYFVKKKYPASKVFGEHESSLL